MPYKQDTFVASLVWGRIGVAVLAMVSFGLSTFGFTFAPADQELAYTTVSGVLAGIAGILAIISKVRESKKISA